MDAVSLTASIIALAQGAQAIFEYIKDIRDGPSTRTELIASLAPLENLLLLLKDQFQSTTQNPPWTNAVKLLGQQDGPFAQLTVIIEKIRNKLEVSSGGQSKKLFKTLTWSLDKADVTELLLRVDRVKSLVMLAIQNDHVKLSEMIYADLQAMKTGMDDITHKVDNISGTIGGVGNQVQDLSTQIEPIAVGIHQVQAQSMTADLRAFVNWLSPLNFEATQYNFVSSCTPSTGEWLLADAEFQRWTAGHVGILWCPGDPGVGKTMLASRVIDHLQKLTQGQPGVGVAYIFCDYRQSSIQGATDVIGSVLRQLLINSEEIPGSLHSIHNCYKAVPPQQRSLRDFTTTLEAQIQLYSCVYLVIDALDESSSETRDILISTVHRLAKSGRLHVLVTSRQTIGDEFANDSQIHIWANDGDIRRYITQRIRDGKELQKVVNGDKTLQDEIINKVAEKADGMFLLVRLHLDSLTKKYTPKILREALMSLPKDINNSYDETMRRIVDQGEEYSQLAHRVFLWLAFAKRALTLLELRHALAVSEGMDEMELDALIQDGEFVASVCGGLVVIDKSQYGSFPRLVHYTTKEYFELEVTTLFPDAQLSLAMTCLRYLSFKTFDTIDLREIEWEKRILFEYTSKHWGDHALSCEDRLCSGKERDVVLRFLRSVHNVQQACLFMAAFNQPQYYDSWNMKLAPHLLARLGLAKILEMLINTGASADAPDVTGRTPLFHAIEANHLSVVRYLVSMATTGHGASSLTLNPNAMSYLADSVLGTALHRAVNNNAPEIVELLLSLPNVKLELCTGGSDRESDSDLSPLSHAAYKGHLAIVRILTVRPDVDVNHRSDVDGHTALTYAAMEGHLPVVEHLLQHPDIQPDLPNLHRHIWYDPSHTALQHAIRNGKVEVVEKLSSYVDINLVDKNHCTPLSQAAKMGKDKIVACLLRHPQILPNLADSQGITPLMYAARRSHLSTLEVLLSAKDVKVDLVDAGGIGLLGHAIYGGDAAVINHVVDVMQIVLDSEGKETLQGLLSHAAAKGHEEVVTMLLKSSNINPNALDSDLRTALSYAAERGQTGVVKILLELPSILPELADRKGMTPLMFSTQWNHYNIIVLLLEHSIRHPLKERCNSLSPTFSSDRDLPDIARHLLDDFTNEAEFRDRDGRTALSQSVGGDGYSILDTVRYLIEHHNADPNSQDSFQRTPLFYAVQQGDTEVVKYLLELPTIKPHLADHRGRTPLSYAAECNSYWGDIIVLYLLDGPGTDPNSVDFDGRTPISYAVQSSWDITKRLLSVAGIKPDIPDKKGRTPLSYATEGLYPNSDIVDMLLDRDDVNPNSYDSRGRPPLSYATESDIVDRLIKLPNIEMNYVDSMGMTPLMHCAEQGFKYVEKFLDRGGVNLDVADKRGRTLLMLCCWGGCGQEVVQHFVEDYHVDLNARSKNQRTALSWAVLRGDKTAVEILLQKYHVDPNVRDRHSCTPLYYALSTCRNPFEPCSPEWSWRCELGANACKHKKIAKLLRKHKAILDGPDLLEVLGSRECRQIWDTLYGLSDDFELFEGLDDQECDEIWAALDDQECEEIWATLYGDLGPISTPEKLEPLVEYLIVSCWLFFVRLLRECFYLYY
ncbi:ankyrin repeat-containing domain protein [Mycena floridula]|nr:ankyrin repeat-containing domain protein [Mycena floridula]